MEKLFFGLIGAFVLVICFLGLDYLTGSTRMQEVEVIERAYRPASTGVGIAQGTSSNGTSGSGVIVTVEGEEYTLIVRLDGEVLSARVSAEQYAEAHPGDRISLAFRYGGLTGWRL